MNYKIYTPANAPEASRNTLQALEEKIGFIPNILGTMAASPTTLNSVASINMALEQSALSPVERRVVTLTVSTENACKYCVPAQSAMAEMEQMPGETLNALREQDILDDAKLNALREFVLQVMHKKGWVEDKQVQTFIQSGYTEQHVFDVISIIALMTLTNYVAHITGVELDNNFMPYQWESTQEVA